MGPYVTYLDYLSQLAARPLPCSEDYAQYLNEISSLQRTLVASSTVMFLADFHTQHYPYMSLNAKQVTGHAREAFLEGGLPFMFHHLRDFSLVNQQMFPDEMRFLFKQEPGLVNDQFRFSRSYRFRDESGRLRTLLQRTTPVKALGLSTPVISLGFAWDITHLAEPGKIIHQIEQFDPASGSWVLRFSKEYYPDIEPGRLLGKREVEILKWAIEGYGSKQIADKLCISVHTVNTHRRNMLRKTNCQNALELMRYAIEHRLL